MTTPTTNAAPSGTVRVDVVCDHADCHPRCRRCPERKPHSSDDIWDHTKRRKCWLTGQRTKCVPAHNARLDRPEGAKETL